MGMKCSWDPADFSADDFYEFNKRNVRVKGHGRCPTAGFSVTLEADPANDDPEQHIMAVKLTETGPENIAGESSEVQIDVTLPLYPTADRIKIEGVGVIPVGTDEIAQLVVGITQIDGRAFGPKEFIMRISEAILGTKFQLDGATFEVTHSILAHANVPFDGS